MKPPPKDWPRISSSIFYRDAPAAIDWLCKALGFEVRLRIEGEGGRIEHSELIYGEGLIMVGQEPLEPIQPGSPGARLWKNAMRGPQSMAGANTQCVMIFVDDADVHCAHARACGARIVEEPATHDYGADYWTDRSYGMLDPEGHMWWIAQRMHTAGDSGVNR